MERKNLKKKRFYFSYVNKEKFLYLKPIIFKEKSILDHFENLDVV